MKYYIATSLSRMMDHNLTRDALKILGHEISYDWTLHESVKSVSKECLREFSINDLKGVSEADFVVVLLPAGKGTHIELGFAIAKAKRVFLYSENPALFELGPETNPFYHHPDVIQLSCPLVDTASLIHSLLELPATL